MSTKPEFSKDHALESFRYGPRLLTGILRQLPKRMWNYKPTAEVWSIHEIVIHLADVEAAEYLNCRTIITATSASTSDPSIAATETSHWAPPDLAKWSLPLGYFYQSPRQALETIKILRTVTHNLLLSLPASIWLVSSPNHSAEGKPNLQEWLITQERYIPAQIERMNELYSMWVKAHRRNAKVRKPRRTFASAAPEFETQASGKRAFVGASKHN
jgi:hypothetical protein